MKIERASLSDLPAIHALVESAFRGDTARAGWTHEADLLDGQRTDRAELETLLGGAPHLVLLARGADGLPIGCVALTDKGDGLAYLGMLTVDPRRQAGGLGKMLMAAAEDDARAAFGATRIELTIIPHRAELTAWYERRGYRLTGETRPWPVDDPRFGIPKVDDLVFAVMEKKL